MNKLSLAQKVRRNKKVILYEMVPPPANLPEKDLEDSMRLFSKILAKYPIDAINLPEVIEETREGDRTGQTVAKIEPRVICRYFQKYSSCEYIVNRPIVYLPLKKQLSWLKKTYDNFNVHNFIFVGGESSKITYPGPTVTQAAELLSGGLKEQFPQVFIGGIVIPSRLNEADRLMIKALAGIEYFTTQILYESEAIKKLLKRYWQLCIHNKVKPKMIFLSFAPISSNKDIELLKWLGVALPEKAYHQLTSTWLGIGWRSFDIATQVLEDVLEYVQKKGIKIPLGLNVEHISRHNFELSLMLLTKLSRRYLIKND